MTRSSLPQARHPYRADAAGTEHHAALLSTNEIDFGQVNAPSPVCAPFPPPVPQARAPGPSFCPR